LEFFEQDIIFKLHDRAGQHCHHHLDDDFEDRHLDDLAATVRLWIEMLKRITVIPELLDGTRFSEAFLRREFPEILAENPLQ
jgi:hypothetical protein